MTDQPFGLESSNYTCTLRMSGEERLTIQPFDFPLPIMKPLSNKPHLHKKGETCFGSNPSKHQRLSGRRLWFSVL